MFFETRLSRYLAEILRNLKEKIFTVQSAFSLILFSLFTGFLFGNLFGTLLDTLRLYFLFNGFVGVFILLLIESINSLVYGISFGTNNFLNNERVSLRSFVTEDSNEKPFKRSPTILAVPKENTRFDVFQKLKNKSSFLLLKIKKTILFFSKKLSSMTPRVYRRKNLLSFSKSIPFPKEVKRTVNSFKIGLLFGFFVDSFKVGS